MILEHQTFVQTLKDKRKNKLVLQIYLKEIPCSVLPNRLPFVIWLFIFRSSTFSSSNTSIFSESIFWSLGKYRNCLIVGDQSSSIKSNCFCLFVYGCCFPPCKVWDTEIGEAICLWNAESWDLECVILLEESGLLLMTGISNLSVH